RFWRCGGPIMARRTVQMSRLPFPRAATSPVFRPAGGSADAARRRAEGAVRATSEVGRSSIPPRTTCSPLLGRTLAHCWPGTFARRGDHTVLMVRLLSTVAIAVVFGVAAGLLPRVAYRLAVPATEPSRRSCAGCGRRFRPGWLGWLRFGRACRTCPADPPGPRWALSGLVALAVGALTWQAHPGTLERDLLLLTWLIVIEAGALLAMIDLAVHRLPTPLVTAMAAGVAACIAMAGLVSRG